MRQIGIAIACFAPPIVTLTFATTKDVLAWPHALSAPLTTVRSASADLVCAPAIRRRNTPRQHIEIIDRDNCNCRCKQLHEQRNQSKLIMSGELKLHFRSKTASTATATAATTATAAMTHNATTNLSCSANQCLM
jgi:hypothetical protein